MKASREGCATPREPVGSGRDRLGDGRAFHFVAGGAIVREDGVVVARVGPAAIGVVRFDERLCAVGVEDGSCRLVDARTGAEVLRVLVEGRVVEARVLIVRGAPYLATASVAAMHISTR